MIGFILQLMIVVIIISLIFSGFGFIHIIFALVGLEVLWLGFMYHQGKKQ